MTVTEARAYCATLAVHPWDDAADATINQAVVRATAAFLSASPHVTPVPNAPGTWWIGATGFDAHGGEPTLAHALDQIARTYHADARVAIADSCVAALAATWARSTTAESTCIIPAGGCAKYLTRVPLSLIPMDEEVREALYTLGLRTAGALAALPPSDVEHRWGALGLAAWRLARGDDRRRPFLARPEPRRSVSADLPTPTTTIDPVLFLIRAALTRLTTQLTTDARTAATIALTLTLDDAEPGSPPHTITRQTTLPRPSARLTPLLEQYRTLLDRFTPTLTAPILGVTVSITATAPSTSEQGDLLTPTWRDPAALDAALTRLRTTLGPLSVVRPLPNDDHRPEHAGVWTEADSAPEFLPNPAPPTSKTPTTPAHRLLPTPEPVTVDDTNGRPTTLHWRSHHLPLTPTAPNHLSGSWWSPMSYTRTYWPCPPLLLFVEHDQWHVQGWQD
jgi:protein ImuB